MFNLVAINLKNANGSLSHKCHVGKCHNKARYQYFAPQATDELPDWEGLPICSHHLVEEARHRPEIILSLIDILIDELESHSVLGAPEAPDGSSRVGGKAKS